MFYIYMCTVSLLMFLFSMFYFTPISLGIILFLTSVFMVFLMSITLSSWYSYILFLVYVGGLLVLFMYMCIMGSNVKFYSKSSIFLIIYLIMYMLMDKFWSENTFTFLGFSSYESSFLLSMSMFLSLTIILLFTFLAIIRIIEMKKPLIV
uniref:NADH dehydrogenase subunit 6 n=1 Tax=Bulinus truncatus TaxID=55810 RepID=UPI001EE0B3DB|nr:NADH dehydrogenase subunit 6 [Bulinus truncatus]QYJ56642.1 NADH dehydrogenase subunit 6 [Bulinus truncatus]